jgi:histidine ammonia-lyase
VYGVNTGFGNFANKIIPKTELKNLQINLIRSHSVGVGKPLEKAQVRMLQILRINTLARGRSGISVHNLKKYIDAFNAHFIGRIPCQGTVGASGDLAPLAHLALGMLGEGLAWSDVQGKEILAAEVLKEKNLLPI